MTTPAEFRPGTTDELAGFIREAQSMTVHCAPAATAASDAPFLDLSLLRDVVDYPSADMTITVQSGLTVAGLRETLESENQQLPIDVPHESATTIGDAVARNMCGSRRFGYGTLRDYVIGITAIDGQGRLFSSGGRVVKNVAGYDLCKLLTGSHGTLGVITQLTLKVKPRPESIGGLRVRFSEADALDAALEVLVGSETRPVVVDVVAADGELSLLLAFAGSQAEVRWQTDRAATEMAPHATESLDATEIRRHLKFAADLAAEAEAGGGFRAGVRPSQVKSILQHAGPETVVVHAGNGIICGLRASAAVESAVSEARGWYRPLSPLANPFSPGAELTLMRRIRQTFDPRGVFNPHIQI